MCVILFVCGNKELSTTDYFLKVFMNRVLRVMVFIIMKYLLN